MTAAIAAIWHELGIEKAHEVALRHQQPERLNLWSLQQADVWHTLQQGSST
jgi:dsRNA-specific ribonuclease